MNTTTQQMYDIIAPYYRKHSQTKIKYLQAVDHFILKNFPKKSKSLLDIGSGDGIRAMNLAKNMGIKTIHLSDISNKMIQLCKKLKPTKVWHINAYQIPTHNYSFDVILCLWNVLGHIENNEKRIKALKKMALLLSKKGVIFLDVNNRYNAVNYGWFNTFIKILIDFFWFNEKRGNVNFTWKIDNKIISAKGHLFTPIEIENIIKAAGLSIVKKATVNYENGSFSTSFLKGQLLYMLKNNLSDRYELESNLGTNF